jgi:hypothetical protein
LLRRAVPRAEVIAPPEVHLGEAAFQATAIWRGEFPVVVLPMRS